MTKRSGGSQVRGSRRARLRRVASIGVMMLLTFPACRAPGEDAPPARDPGADAETEGAREGSSVEDVAPPRHAPDSPPAPPDMATETIRIEGTPQAMPVRTVEAPSWFGARFRATVPADMEVAFEEGAEWDEVRFEARFGGIHNPEAALVLRVFPGETGAEEARTAAEEAAVALGGVAEAQPRYSWAVASWQLRGARSGFLALGERDGRWFYFLSRYPPEYGDGMGPRVALVLETWEW